MWHSNLEKKHVFLDIFSTNIDTIIPSHYQCIETRRIEVFWLLSQPLPHLRFNLLVISETFTTKAELLYARNPSHRKQETFLYEYPLNWVLLPTEAHNRTLLFDSSALKHGRHFGYWNQPLIMRMCVCYLQLDCHEAGLCCYLVIHIETLQLFYFHLWPVYCLSLVFESNRFQHIHQLSRLV
jgi:hypothetical protein